MTAPTTATYPTDRPAEDRIAAVRRYEILDAPRDGSFEAVARVVTAALRVPISTVSIVDEGRVWFAACQGLEGVDEVGTEPGLCASAVLSDGPYVVADAAVDPRTVEHPLVRGALGLRFYAAAPIITESGHHLGTVTAIDTEPREVTEQDTAVLTALADVVADHLELRLRTLGAVRAEQELRSEAEERAQHADALAEKIRAAQADHSSSSGRPVTCELGGSTACSGTPELKVADSWGDSAWGCADHVEEAMIHVRSVFIADHDLAGLGAYRRRRA